MPPGGPAPRAADGRPDLSGVWWPNRTGIPAREKIEACRWIRAALRQFDPNVTPEEPPSFQPWAAAKMKGMTAAQRELAKGSVNCIPRGLPAIWLSNTYAIQFVQTPGLLVQLIEVLNNFRVIHTDGRPHPKYPGPAVSRQPVLPAGRATRSSSNRSGSTRERSSTITARGFTATSCASSSALRVRRRTTSSCRSRSTIRKC